jgi:hypothetical protein
LIIASEHASWLPFDNNQLQAITCYTESPNSANVLTEIQDSFGDKIPVITAAMQPEVTFSQYITEVADPLADVVMNNLLRMPMNLLYYTNFLISSPLARTQRPLGVVAKMHQRVTNISKSLMHLK